ncbi:unnamed protein product [Schistosoma margrebowiei]|uniref:Uncharacterized protein n=1 Tax=Schistosoma margrebowiei TaxID=48269 RepID=A0A183N5N0_9TREM|nr:unnamed protein product [Schistosoma margrebowiei]
MGRPESVVDQGDHSNNCRNVETKLGSTRNQLNLLDARWTAKAILLCYSHEEENAPHTQGVGLMLQRSHHPDGKLKRQSRNEQRLS